MFHCASLRRQLRLDAEAVAVQRRLLEDVGPDRLVAGLHVGQVDVVEDVGQPGQELVGDAVPVEQDLPLARGGEARSEHRVGLALEDRRDQRGIVGRVVLQVGVLDQADVAAHVLDRGPDRASLPHVARLAEDADALESVAASASRISGDPSRLPSSTQISSIGSDTGLARTRATIVRSVRASL